MSHQTAPRFRRLLAAGLVGATALGCDDPAVPPGTGVDVLLVTIDTLRGDRWGCVGDPHARTPFADRLARGGWLVPEGRAPCPVTLPSHASVLTGLPPAVHGVRDNAIFRLHEESGRTVAQALGDAGWSTAAFISSFPLMSRFGLDRGFDLYNDDLENADDRVHLRARSADITTDAVLAWYRSEAAPDVDRPLFTWVHYFDPHAEYEAPAPWPEVTASPYDAEVAFSDHELGRLLRAVETHRGRRAQRIVVLADHGEGLGEFGEQSHGVLLHASTIRVPIIVRTEVFRPQLDTRPYPLESVAATLLELAEAGAALDPGAAPGLASGPPPVVHAETLYPHFNFGWAGLRAREEDGWRLLAGPVDRLYHLADDPGERHDLAAKRPDLVARFREELESEWSRREAASSAGPRSLGQDEIEALRAIGYVGTAAEGGDVDQAFDRGADPESRMPLLDAIHRALVLVGTDPSASLRVLAPVLRQEPANRLALEAAGRAHLRLGRPVEARTALRAAVAAGPCPVTVHLDLARAERLLRNPQGEREALRAALRVDPLSVPARQLEAVLRLDDGDYEGALQLLHEALEIRPRAVGSHFGIARVYEAMGRQEDANRHWKRLLEIRENGPMARAARDALARSESTSFDDRGQEDTP